MEWRHARGLRGAQPQEQPMEQPARFEFVANAKAARAMANACVEVSSAIGSVPMDLQVLNLGVLAGEQTFLSPFAPRRR